MAATNSSREIQSQNVWSFEINTANTAAAAVAAVGRPTGQWLGWGGPIAGFLSRLPHSSLHLGTRQPRRPHTAQRWEPGIRLAVAARCLCTR